MKLTIVTVVKDDLSGLTRTINSIIGYDQKELEIVVVDSSSTTEVEEYLSSLLSDFLITYSWVPASGIYPAMNHGLGIAKGEWIWFLNAGERINPEKSIKNILKDLELTTEDSIAFSVRVVSPSGLVWGHTPARIVQEAGKRVAHVNHQGFLAQRNLIKNLGGFNENFRLAADSELLDRFVSQYSCRIKEDVLVDFYLGGASTKNFISLLHELDSIRNYDLRRSKKYLNRLSLYFRHVLRLNFLKLDGKCPELLKIVLILRNYFRR